MPPIHPSSSHLSKHHYFLLALVPVFMLRRPFWSSSTLEPKFDSVIRFRFKCEKLMRNSSISETLEAFDSQFKSASSICMFLPPCRLSECNFHTCLFHQVITINWVISCGMWRRPRAFINTGPPRNSTGSSLSAWNYSVIFIYQLRLFRYRCRAAVIGAFVGTEGGIVRFYPE